MLRGQGLHGQDVHEPADRRDLRGLQALCPLRTDVRREGGKTIEENCQLLCKEDNRRKSKK